MKKILLLEDDKNLNHGITLKLQKEGYEVSSAFSLKEAEELLGGGAAAGAAPLTGWPPGWPWRPGPWRSGNRCG